jgi:phosphate transport system substrate-binding protein
MAAWSHEVSRQDIDVSYGFSNRRGALQNLARGVDDFACFSVLEAKRRDELAGVGKVVCVPVTIGAVVPVYNLPGLERPLRFSGRVLADIYLGKVERWNEKPLADLNPDVELPKARITPVYPGFPSGTSHLWTSYLSEVSPEWKRRVGAGFEPKWPAGKEAFPSVGVTGEVRKTPGALGFTEMAYVLVNRDKMQGFCGLIQNREGWFVAATPETVTEAARCACETEGGLPVSLINVPGEGAYPVCGFAWAVARLNAPVAKRVALARYLRYATNEGQGLTTAKGYAPLPANVVRHIETDLGALEKGAQDQHPE